MTAGYGECSGFSGSSTSGYRYTQTFSGTSSASAVTAAALTLFQSWALRELGAPLTPRNLRDILKSTGHRQTDSSGNIGPHTNLKAAAEAARGGGPSPPPSPSPSPSPSPTPPSGCTNLETSCDYW